MSGLNRKPNFHGVAFAAQVICSNLLLSILFDQDKNGPVRIRISLRRAQTSLHTDYLFIYDDDDDEQELVSRHLNEIL